jgi:hypothetical protein
VKNYWRFKHAANAVAGVNFQCPDEGDVSAAPRPSPQPAAVKEENMKLLASAAKAVFAAVAAGIAALGAVLVAGNTLGDVTDAQWVVIVGAVLAAGYGTYQTPNKPPVV